jgi:O-antigen/teichoic acid export membrane protein
LSPPLPRVTHRLRKVLTNRVRQILQSLSASVGIQVFLFGSGILVARSLGPAGRGDIAIVLILPAVATQVVCLGVPSAATYFIARAPTAWRVIFRHLPMIALIQAVIAGGVVLALNSYFLGDKAEPTRLSAWLVVGAVPLLIAQYYGLAVIQGFSDLRWWNIIRIAPTAFYTIGLLAGLFFGLSIVACTALWVGSQLVTTLALGGLLRSRYRGGSQDLPGGAEIPTRRELVRFGVVGFLAQVSPVETFRIDSLLVAALFPSQIVGYYAVATSLSNAPRLVADGIVAVGYPHVSSQNEQDGRASTMRYLLLSAVLCAGVTVVIVLALPFLIPLLFGKRFEPAVGVSAILVVAIAVISVRRVGSDCLRGLGKPGASTLIEIFTLGVLAVAFLFLAHWQEGRGVALSLVIASAIGLAMMLVLVSRRPESPPI